jgi:hypothetical protein
MKLLIAQFSPTSCHLKLKLKLQPTVGLRSGTRDQIFLFCLTVVGFLCWAPSLTRGLVCNLLEKLILGFAKRATLGSKTRRTHDHILLSDLRIPQPGGLCSRMYIPQEQSSPVIPPRHWVPLSSPLTTRSAMVELF